MNENKIKNTKVGDDIHFFVNGSEDRGIVVKMNNEYVTVFKESTQNYDDIHINDTFFIKDILINKEWDKMEDVERFELLQSIHAPTPRFLSKSWDQLPKEIKTLLVKNNGIETSHKKDEDPMDTTVRTFDKTLNQTSRGKPKLIGTTVGDDEDAGIKEEPKGFSRSDEKQEGLTHNVANFDEFKTIEETTGEQKGDKNVTGMNFMEEGGDKIGVGASLSGQERAQRQSDLHQGKRLANEEQKKIQERKERKENTNTDVPEKVTEGVSALKAWQLWLAKREQQVLKDAPKDIENREDEKVKPKINPSNQPMSEERQRETHPNAVRMGEKYPRYNSSATQHESTMARNASQAGGEEDYKYAKEGDYDAWTNRQRSGDKPRIVGDDKGLGTAEYVDHYQTRFGTDNRSPTKDIKRSVEKLELLKREKLIHEGSAETNPQVYMREREGKERTNISDVMDKFDITEEDATAEVEDYNSSLSKSWEEKLELLKREQQINKDGAPYKERKEPSNKPMSAERREAGAGADTESSRQDAATSSRNRGQFSIVGGTGEIDPAKETSPKSSKGVFGHAATGRADHMVDDYFGDNKGAKQGKGALGKSWEERLLELKSSVETSIHGNAARNPNSGVNTNTSFDAPKDYEGFSHDGIRLEQFKHEKKKPNVGKEKVNINIDGKEKPADSTNGGSKNNEYGTPTENPTDKKGRIVSEKDKK